MTSTIEITHGFAPIARAIWTAHTDATAIGPIVSSLFDLRAPLQVETDVEGGETLVVLAAIVTFFIALGLAVLVTYRFVEGYRRTRRRPILLLAIGMFLLAPAPMFIRLLVGNIDPLPLSIQLLATTLSELCGLLILLYVIYTT